MWRSELRQEGLGRRLMREVESERHGGWVCGGWNCMCLREMKERSASMSGMGYERISMRKEFYGEAGLDAFVYRKELHVL